MRPLRHIRASAPMWRPLGKQLLKSSKCCINTVRRDHWWDMVRRDVTQAYQQGISQFSDLQFGGLTLEQIVVPLGWAATDVVECYGGFLLGQLRRLAALRLEALWSTSTGPPADAGRQLSKGFYRAIRSR